ncbi:MAG: class I SAM-dependent methyltransferase [Candidatus Angelobacter sp.]
MDPIDFQKPIRKYFQRKRFKNFVSDYQSCKTILDVGGGRNTWEILGRSTGVTILNILPPRDTGGFTYVQASACDIPFPDKSFDLAFSNSAIEHVGSEENQFKFAHEMMRVGKRIYCQTPSRLFPIDPHLTAPFLHWLPNSWLTPGFLRYFTLIGWLLRKPYQYDVTWISKRKLKKMFPGCKITTERFLLLPKSFTVTN